MAKKKKLDMESLYRDDEVLISLKERYFKLMSKETIGKTPELTATIDKIEAVIRKRKEEILNENS
jgi:hypothetical protein